MGSITNQYRLSIESFSFSKVSLGTSFLGPHLNRLDEVEIINCIFLSWRIAMRWDHQLEQTDEVSSNAYIIFVRRNQTNL